MHSALLMVGVAVGVFKGLLSWFATSIFAVILSYRNGSINRGAALVLIILFFAIPDGYGMFCATSIHDPAKNNNASISVISIAASLTLVKIFAGYIFGTAFLGKMSARLVGIIK